MKSSNHIFIYKKFGITGRVQGVFYRQSTYLQASELSLIGWVQNQPNGDVQVWVKGTVHKINLLESWLKIGPPRSSVTAVTELTLSQQEIDKLEALSDFTIIR